MSKGVQWREEPLGRHHDGATFDCGVPAWYARCGAWWLKDNPLKLVLPLDTLKAALSRLGTP